MGGSVFGRRNVSFSKIQFYFPFDPLHSLSLLLLLSGNFLRSRVSVRIEFTSVRNLHKIPALAENKKELEMLFSYI